LCHLAGRTKAELEGANNEATNRWTAETLMMEYEDEVEGRSGVEWREVTPVLSKLVQGQ
jgi:hypothetical protein